MSDKFREPEEIPGFPRRATGSHRARRRFRETNDGVGNLSTGIKPAVKRRIREYNPRRESPAMNHAEGGSSLKRVVD